MNGGLGVCDGLRGSGSSSTPMVQFQRGLSSEDSSLSSLKSHHPSPFSFFMFPRLPYFHYFSIPHFFPTSVISSSFSCFRVSFSLLYIFFNQIIIALIRFPFALETLSVTNRRLLPFEFCNYTCKCWLLHSHPI